MFPLVFWAQEQSSDSANQLTHTILLDLERKLDQPPYLGVSGVYPSYVNGKKKFKTKHRDLTIFYNVLIDNILRRSLSKLSGEDSLLAERLLLKSRIAYSHFENPHRRGTYNFWRRDSVYTIPYHFLGSFLNNHPNVPDDFDDSGLGYCALGKSSDSARYLHQLMLGFRNKKPFKNKRILNAYRNIEAYSSWFGENFPVVFDVCVISNMLWFIHHYQLPWNRADSAGLQLLTTVLGKDADIKENPLLLSPYYGTKPIIYYHVANLMADTKIDTLESLKPSMIEQVRQLLTKSKDPFETLLLQSTLQRLGFETSNVLNTSQLESIRISDYPFFIGNVRSYFSIGISKILGKSDILLYYHFCPAFNEALLFDLIMRKKE